MRILVVEDDLQLRRAIVDVLADEGYQVDEADNGEEGFMYASRDIYDVLVLDIMLPGMDGVGLIQALRKQHIFTPSLFVTAKDSIEARVEGLNAGADDYLVKPFAVEELLARVRALSRRIGTAVSMAGEIRYGPLRLSTNSHEGYVDNEPLNLTGKEYELLEYMVRNKEQILTRSQLLDRVWGLDSEAGEAIVEVYVHYVRKKLSKFHLDSWVQTVRGVGYMLKEDPHGVQKDPDAIDSP